MNSRERLLAALRKQEVDRIPWSPLIDGYFTSSLPQQGYKMNVVETVRFIGADLLERHVPTVKTSYKNVEFKEQVKGEEKVGIYETPIGSIYNIHKKTGNTTFLAKPLVKTEEDVKVLQYIYENTFYEPAYDEFEKEQKYIGDDGLATTSGPLTPIQSLLQHYMHIEPFTYGIMDYQESLEELMAVMHHKNLEVYKLMAQSPAEVIFDYEDTSTTVMSPTWYDIYCKNNIDQYAGILHNSDKIYITHMCGKLKGFKTSLAEGKMDGIDSVCPPTTGDTWLHEALEMWPGKVIIGGIEPPMLQRMNPKETRAYVENILEKVNPKASFILSTGDATPYGTPIENLIEITKIIKLVK